jgi:pyruvate kinase
MDRALPMIDEHVPPESRALPQGAGRKMFARNTKIVATLGPATGSPEMIARLAEAGADVFRINASHGGQEHWSQWIRAVREAGILVGRPCAVLLDLQGPKVRLGEFRGGGCYLQTGSQFTLTVEPVLGDAGRASTDYAAFAREVSPGDRILLADGTVELRAFERNAVEVHCLVVRGGPVSDRKGINVPSVDLGLPSLTENDIRDLKLGLKLGIDFVALSFVRRAGDVLRLRDFLDFRQASPAVVAKIEKPQAIDEIDAIIEYSDGVMVARGDLGVELGLEKVPAVQKAIIERARIKGKFTITATQMLESMVEQPSPTRAEVSDIANAIYDGTDAVMLSAETSIGRHPVESVSTMASVISESEAATAMTAFRQLPQESPPSPADIVAEAAARAAKVARAAAMAVFTASGASARLVSRYRPAAPVYSFTPGPDVAHRLMLNYGVHPIVVPDVDSTDEMLALVERELVRYASLDTGDTVVFVAGHPPGRSGTTNLMKLHRIGELPAEKREAA